MIEVAKGDWIAPEHVARVKTIDADHCCLWTVGQSALDNHIVGSSAETVVDMIHDEIYGPEEDDEIKTDSEEEDSVDEP